MGRCYDEDACQLGALDCRWDYDILVRPDPYMGICGVKHQGKKYPSVPPGSEIPITGLALSIPCTGNVDDHVYIYNCDLEKIGTATLDFECRKCPVADQP